MIAVICVAPRSVYKSLPGLDVYDKNRDARTFRRDKPLIAHPPCRGWSAFCAHQAHATDDEKRLGIECAEWLRECGGVLEQPAHSRLFKAAGLPMPGHRQGNLRSVYVEQSAWGYPMRKATWLCFCRIDVDALQFPTARHDSRSGEGDRRRQQRMSKNQRAATHPAFANFLIDAARSVQ